MACNVTAARGLNCRDQVGGIKAIYLSQFDPAFYDGLTITADTNTFTAISAAQTVYRYDVRPQTSSFTVSINAADAGSAAYDIACEVTLHSMTSADNAELANVIGSLMIVYVLDANDNVWALGVQNGVQVTAGSASTGTARADLNGYLLTISGSESSLPLLVAAPADATAANWPFDSITTTVYTVNNPS